METDRSIALLEKEQWMRETEEQREQERVKYDPKRKVNYTLEELIKGIKKGEQYLYTLRMNFESREVFGGELRIPFAVDFYDLIQEQKDSLLWGNKGNKTVLTVMRIPCGQMKQSFEEWVSQSKDALTGLNLHPELLCMEAVNRMEYFCYEMPTSEGVTYNLSFRYPKHKIVYVGSLNCMNEDKDGMGLMLEALVRVTEEING